MPKLISHKPTQRTAPIKWVEFTDGRPRLFIRGEDFNGSVETLRNRAYNAANRIGWKAKTEQEGCDLVIWFIKPKRKRPTKRV